MRSYYEYDEEREVLIKIQSEELPKILRRSEGRWRDFKYTEDSYIRAIYIGQGCWERLETITLEEGQRILNEWGVE